MVIIDAAKQLTEETERQIFALIRKAGALVRSAHNVEQTEGAVEEKPGTANFVTVYDVRVQNELVQGFRNLLPDAKFMAEEQDVQPEHLREGLCFVIDPIDGTTNFIHDYHCSTVSVGILLDGEPYFGAVYNPYQDELFSARRGQGAFCNGKPIRVSSRPLENALISCGTTPYYKETMTEQTFHLLKLLYLAGGDIRRSGSAAFDLCMVACGRTDAFCEMRLYPWDYAAGALIVAEAGGIASQMDGTPLRMDDCCSVLAGGKENYQAILQLLRQ